MKAKIHVAILIVSSCFIPIFGDLPSEVIKCKSQNNDDCITKNIRKIIELYPYGNPEFGLPNISAIARKELIFAESKEDTPIQLNFKFNSLIIGGLEKIQPLHAHGFNKNLTNTLELDFLIPLLTITGDYIMNGKLLLLPLNGKGIGKVIFKDTVLKFKAKVETEKCNNKNYGKISKLKLWSMEPKKIVFNLENIINKNVILSQSINEVINENWSDLWNEFRKNTIKSTEEIIIDIANGVLNKLSIDDFYSD